MTAPDGPALDPSALPLLDDNPSDTDGDVANDTAYSGSDATLAALRDEHAAARLGPLWLDEITRASRYRARQFPPVIFARATAWTATEIEDLVMDTVERILEKNQIEYICDTVADLGHARALLRRQVWHTLMSRRTRTVVDNLVDRAVTLLDGHAYTPDQVPPPGWKFADSTGELDPDPMAVRLLGLRLRRLPRLAGDGIERASPVWTADVLQKAVDDCLGALGKVTRNSLQKVFTDALTSLVASELVSDEAGTGHTDLSASPEEQALATDAVNQLELTLDAHERVVLARKLQDVADKDIATELGLSRPTVDKRKKSGAAKVREVLTGLPVGAQDAALAEFQHRLLEEDGR